MRAVLRLDAFARDARPHDLGEPVDVDRVHVEPPLDLAAHLVRPRLGAEDPDLQRRRLRIDALTCEFVEDREHVRRRHHDDVRLEVDDQPHLALGHAARHGDHGAAESLGAAVRAEAACEEPVAVRDVDAVAAPAAGGADRACYDVRPRVEIALRVADDSGASRRPARRVDACDALARDGEHPEWVRLA